MREKAIDVAVSTIEKQFGKGAIMRLGDGTRRAEVQVIPTGSLALDIALGVGGIRAAASSRSTVRSLRARRRSPCTSIAEAQKPGGICAFIDAEHALDVGYARKLGVSMDELLVSQPDTGEQALEIAEMLVRSGAVDVIVVDSVAALVRGPRSKARWATRTSGLQARLMSQALRKLTGSDRADPTRLVIFINQIRKKIGVMFGNPETTTGGNALKFYASVRMDVRRIGAIKNGDEGRRQPHPREGGEEQDGAAVQRSGVRHPLRQGEGISHEGDLVDLGAEAGVVESQGAWFGFGGDRIGQGRENAKQFLREHPGGGAQDRGEGVRPPRHQARRRRVRPPAVAAVPPVPPARRCTP